MNYEVALEAIICGDDCTDEQVSDTLGVLMEALVDLGVDDPSVGGSLTSRKVEVALVVEADSEEQAFALENRQIVKALRRTGLEVEPKPSAPRRSPRAKPARAPALEWSSTSVRPAVVA